MTTTRRNTHQKELILSTIQGKNNHHTAEEILELVQKEDPNIGLATVYRNLNLFVEEGLIQRVKGDNWSFFDGNPDPHDHFHCAICGKVMDMPGEYNKKMDQNAETKTHVKILSHSTTYEGICEECLKRENRKGE